MSIQKEFQEIINLVAKLPRPSEDYEGLTDFEFLAVCALDWIISVQSSWMIKCRMWIVFDKVGSRPADGEMSLKKTIQWRRGMTAAESNTTVRASGTANQAAFRRESQILGRAPTQNAPAL